MLQAPLEDTSEKMKVYLRIRPFLTSELDRQEDQVGFKVVCCRTKEAPWELLPSANPLSTFPGLCLYREHRNPSATGTQRFLCLEEQ